MILIKKKFAFRPLGKNAEQTLTQQQQTRKSNRGLQLNQLQCTKGKTAYRV